jgi:general secretion pathway protein F
MTVYEFAALDRRGKKIKGQIDAESPALARQKIRLSHGHPTLIREVGGRPAEGAGGTASGLSPRSIRLRPMEAALLTRQLATLTAAGFPLVRAIETLLPLAPRTRVGQILTGIKDLLTEGKSFAEALARFPATFSGVYVSMVRAGEASGTLEIVLDRLAEISEKQIALAQKVKSALAYPALMALVGVAVVAFLVTYIVPQITQIFIEMRQGLPLPTRWLIALSAAVKAYWWLMALGAAVLLFCYASLAKTAWGKGRLDRLRLFLPGWGGLTRKLVAARLGRTLGSLLENGIPLSLAMEVIKGMTGNGMVQAALEGAIADLHTGKGLSVALSGSGIFPPLALQMIQVGEQSGRLEEMLRKLADVFEKEVDQTITQLTSLLEPIMILVMGVVVGAIVLAICLPIFEMNQLVR